jgi:hypothetical protein
LRHASANKGFSKKGECIERLQKILEEALSGQNNTIRGSYYDLSSVRSRR